jgi:hypothetical protein
LNDSHRDAGDAELALRRGDESLQLRNLGRAEAPRRLSSERFTFERFWQKAAVDERALSIPLVDDRSAHVFNHHGPPLPRDGRHPLVSA